MFALRAKQAHFDKTKLRKKFLDPNKTLNLMCLYFRSTHNLCKLKRGQIILI